MCKRKLSSSRVHVVTCLDHRDAAGFLSLYNTPTLFNTPASTENWRGIQPLHSFKNLVTEISSISMNNDNSILIYASKEKENQVRAVHLQSLSVFGNWPDQREHLGNVLCSSISGDNRRNR